MLLLKPVLDTMLCMIREDRDAEAIMCTLESLPKVFTELGPASLEPQIQEVMTALMMVFDKQTFCQTLRERFDEDERDLELLNAAVDCAVDMLKY